MVSIPLFQVFGYPKQALIHNPSIDMNDTNMLLIFKNPLFEGHLLLL